MLKFTKCALRETEAWYIPAESICVLAVHLANWTVAFDMETLMWNDAVFSTETVDGKRFWVVGLPVPI